MSARHETPARFPSGTGRQPETGRARGFGYIGLLILVAIMSIALAAAGEIWHTAMKREKEQELLFVGAQFRRALEQFYANTPRQGRRYPLNLQELLLDPRHPGIRRYLRKIYADPMTGRTEWGLVSGPNGEIYGVYSLSEAEPLKQGSFRLLERGFEGAARYSDWVFMPTVR